MEESEHHAAQWLPLGAPVRHVQRSSGPDDKTEIHKFDVSLDNGRTWEAAQVRGPLDTFAATD